NKTSLKFDYTAASPSIGGQIKVNFETEKFIPDITLLKGPLNRFIEIAKKCESMLDGYSRILGSRSKEIHDLERLALLPKELFEKTDNEHLKKLRELLKKNVHGFVKVDAKSFLSIWGWHSLANLSKKQHESICLLIEKLGYSIAPDIRYHKAKISIDGKIILFDDPVPENFVPSSDFWLTALIIRLGMIVSKSDQEVDKSEILYLSSLIYGNNKLSKYEKRSLRAYMEWRIHEQSSKAGLKKKIERLTNNQKKSIGHILIQIVNADGKITPQEIDATETLFTSLGLGRNNVIELLHNSKTASSPITVAKAEGEADYSIPQPPPDISRDALRLDENIIKLRSAETKQIQNILTDIFEDEQEEIGTTHQVPSDNLSDKHRALYEFLITKGQWPLDDVNSFCKEKDIMLEGAVEIINEWTGSLVNSPLIELADMVYVDIDLLEELT
ncbi:hypothetical protein GF319_05490, partial [Candidatus Bathyarchaeota archaeon]|nr:hypothetical protein [Candidatus Bathyarchaeota archaeon]